MKPSVVNKVKKICRRCNRNYATDKICPACKNELISLYDNKLSWKTAFEVERVSRKARLYTQNDSDDDI